MESRPSADDEDDSRASQRQRMSAPERRATILHAGLRMFASRGYEGTTMDDIAAEAGVSKAVVYDHFASKRELYLVVLDGIRRDLDGVIEAALAPAGVAGEERVRVALSAFFQYVEEHPEACHLLLIELQGTLISPVGRTLEERVTNGIAATLGADGTLLARHPQRERHLLLLAELLKSAVHGLASWWYRHPEVPCEDVVERCVGIVWPAIVQARAS